MGLFAALTIAVASVSACGGTSTPTASPPTRPAPTAAASGPSAAQAVAQELSQPASADILRDLYARLGLQNVRVQYRDGTAFIAFEQPDVPAGTSQAIYLLVLDLAGLNAPFSERVSLAIEVGGQPFASIAAQTSDISAYHRGQLSAAEFLKRLKYALTR